MCSSDLFTTFGTKHFSAHFVFDAVPFAISTVTAFDALVDAAAGFAGVAGVAGFAAVAGFVSFFIFLSIVESAAYADSDDDAITDVTSANIAILARSFVFILIERSLI